VNQTEGAESREAGRELILLRLGAEIALKSRRTRSNFVRILRANVIDALGASGVEGRVDTTWGRLFVRSEPGAVPALSRVFGISSMSRVAREVPADLETITEAGRQVFTEAVRGRRFAVRARRTGRHPFRSRDVEVRLGALLLPESTGVDLSNPEIVAHVEVRDETAYLFSGRVEGAGGLPLGVEGKAVALLSGGFDSAVAAWLMMKRGVRLDYVFCNLGGDAYERAVLQVAKVLSDSWSYGTRPRLHVVDFAEPVRELRETVRQSYWQVVLKRLMYRAATRIGQSIGAAGIVTGEAIGQVSSQTLLNLGAIEPAADLPVYRPLIGFDKAEIIDRARAIGTAALSEQVREYCAIAPGRPVTAASPERAQREDSAMDPSILDAAVAGRRTIDLRSMSPSDLVAPYLFTTTVPDDAIVFDCRTEAQYRTWHLSGAEHRDEWELLRAIPSLNRDRVYVLYCTHGIQTAYLAEKMQRAGIEAHSFKGGVRALMKMVEETGAL
jgi:thiamine biosynthesis protein ThiI